MPAPEAIGAFALVRKMLAKLCDLESILRCPVSLHPLVRDGDVLRSHAGAQCYPEVGGTPVLIDFRCSVRKREELLAQAAQSAIARPSHRGVLHHVKRLVSPEKESTRRNIDRLIHALPRRGGATVLVIGGGTIGQGLGALYDDPDLRVIAFDLYASPNVQFVADAHQIPLAESSCDAVVIQAVLEHVLEPQRVVQEIWRVLKPNGLVYAETPFLQQVHEGAYDFTRFTESGHRYLFKQFEMIDSGVSGGPGTQLIWSLDYFARSLFRSRLAGKMCKLAFAWLRLFDQFIPPSYASDAASGVYFLGRRSLVTVDPDSIIDFYRGAHC